MVVISLVLVVLSTLGIADTAFLSYQKILGVVPACHLGFSCTSVLNSPWSMIGPVPLAFVGLAYYVLVGLIAASIFLDKKHFKLTPRLMVHPHTVLLILTTSGLLMSLYLVSIMGLVLKSWCLFCLFSAGTSISLFVTAVVLYRLKKDRCELGCPSDKRVLLGVMYQLGLKPLFFLFPAETVHQLMTGYGQRLGQSEFGRKLTRWLFAFHDLSLTKKIDGIFFSNPVGLAAGFDYEADLTQILPEVGFGFMTIGTVTLRSYSGNPKPRLGRFPSSHSLLVNKGFKSPGAKAIIKKLSGKKFQIPLGISIGSTNAAYPSLATQVQDITRCFTLFEASNVKHLYYELNISCPNTAGGQPFTTPNRLELLLTKLDGLKIERPVYLKMPIDLTPQETVALLNVAKKHQVRGVIFGNLTKDKNNPDVTKVDRQAWTHSAGNLSGKPTWNRSNALVALTRKHFGSRFTIIGTGGIFNGRDAQMKLDLGADLVQLITGMVYQGPQVVGEINQYLSHPHAPSDTIVTYESRSNLRLA
jgi:dihydroorotate dehydrogenase